MLSKFTGIWTTRLVYWLIAWKIFLNSPFLGSGPHTYSTLYTTYKNKLYLPKWIEVDERFAPWPHNLYMEILAEQGIVGLITLCILIACGLTSAWNICKTSEHTEIGNFGKSIFISLILFTISAVFELSFLRHWVVIMLFSILGIIMALSSNLKDQRRL
ncbi:MAG: O-antigen ligase family protein [Desulfobacteraceae bacterium]|nr:O-antigen ligase family protein [Desulfobacteraceae bacterium]